MEIRDLYDAKKKRTGKTFIKGEQVPKGYYYLIVEIIIENSTGEFLIQKRVDTKGGKWALTGGHPKANENSFQGLCSEVREELGIDISHDNPILYAEITHNDQFFDLYYLKKDIDISEFKLQQEEVDDVKWVTLDEINKLYQEGNFHDGHYQVIKEYLKYQGKR